MLHQVLKAFKAEGKDLQVGDIVETSHWRHERLLLERRFIGKPSVPQEVVTKVEAGTNAKELAQPVEAAAGETLTQEPPKAVPTKPVVLNRVAGVSGKPKVPGSVPVAKKR
jgi:hypothetical protein